MVCDLGLRLGISFNGYTRASGSYVWQGEDRDREKYEQPDGTCSAGSAARRPGGVARHVAGVGRADPAAAAELPADDPADDGYLHAAPEHSGFLPLRTGRAAATNAPADVPAVDGAGPTATASLPADDPGSAKHGHAALQHPTLLRPGRFAVGPVPHRGLRRVDGGGGLRAPWRSLRRRASDGARLRGAQQEPRHTP